MNWLHLVAKHQKALDAASGIDTWTKPEELAWLAEEASNRQRVLEIGTYKGASAAVMAESTQGVVMCFDMCPDEGVEAAARRNLHRYIEAGRLMLLQKHAGVSAVRHAAFYEMRFNMIWIDDGHRYEDVIRDLLTAMLLRMDADALICGHDYESDVKRAVDDCFGTANVKRGPGSVWYL